MYSTGTQPSKNVFLIVLLLTPTLIQGFGLNLIKVPDDDHSQVVCPMALLRKYFNSGESLSGFLLYMSLTTAPLLTQKRLLEAINLMVDIPWTVVVRNPKTSKSTSLDSAPLHEKPQCYFVVIENLEDEDLEDIFEDWRTTINWNPLAQFVVYLTSVEETDEEMTELMIEILLSFMNKKIYNVNVIGQNEENGYYYGKTVFPYHPDNNCGNRVISIETLDVCEYQDGNENKDENDDDDENDENERDENNDDENNERNDYGNDDGNDNGNGDGNDHGNGDGNNDGNEDGNEDGKDDGNDHDNGYNDDNSNGNNDGNDDANDDRNYGNNEEIENNENNNDDNDEKITVDENNDEKIQNDENKSADDKREDQNDVEINDENNYSNDVKSEDSNDNGRNYEGYDKNNENEHEMNHQSSEYNGENKDNNRNLEDSLEKADNSQNLEGNNDDNDDQQPSEDKSEDENKYNNENQGENVDKAYKNAKSGEDINYDNTEDGKDNNSQDDNTENNVYTRDKKDNNDEGFNKKDITSNSHVSGEIKDENKMNCEEYDTEVEQDEENKNTNFGIDESNIKESQEIGSREDKSKTENNEDEKNYSSSEDTNINSIETYTEPKVFLKEIFRALFLDKFPKDLSGCPLVAAYRPWEPYIFTETTEMDADYSESDSTADPSMDYSAYDTGPLLSEESIINKHMTGIEYKLLQTIGERLHISIDIQVENKNLYHLFQQLIDGDIEIVVGGIDEDPRISQFVSTTIPYHQDDLTWCVAKASRSYNLFSFVQSFSKSVWLCIFGFLVVASLVVTFMKRFLRIRLKYLRGYFSILFRMMGVILNQSMPIAHMPTPVRSIFSAAFFAGLLLINAYQSFLISTLTTPRSAYQISQTEEIYRNHMTIMGSVENVRHLNKDGEVFKYIREKFQMCYDIEECLMQAAENNHLAVAVSRQYSFYNPRIPRNRLFCFDRNENLYVYLVTMLLPKKFHLLHKINPVIQHVIESGHMQKWARDLDMRRRILEEHSHVHEKVFRTLTLDQVMGPFVFACGLLIFAIFILFLEHWVYWMVSKRRRTRLKLVKFLHRRVFHS